MAGKTQLQCPLLGVVALAVIAATVPSTASAHLSVSFYVNTCPSVFDIVRAGVRSAVNRETRMGASLIRLFFHDCFVNGCDGSVLLEDIGSFVGERTANANKNSIRGFSVIDSIKAQVDSACGAGVVSCADILAIAARDSVVELGGSCYSIPVGRRDARTASLLAANNDIPAPFENLDVLLRKFSRKGFTAQEMVVLSGGHTVGLAQCRTFRSHIYNDPNIDPAFAAARRANCPATAGQGDSNLAPLDAQSPNRFDESYFQLLTNRRGLLQSDQALFNGSSTDAFVTTYSNDGGAFDRDFGNAMVKMGNLGPLTGSQGEIRINCQRVN